MKKIRLWTDGNSHLYRVGRLPNPGDEVPPSKAAAALGVDVADVIDLVNDGVLAVKLTDKGQPMIDAKSLADFASKLRPLDIIIEGDEVEVKAKPPKAAQEAKAAEQVEEKANPKRKRSKAVEEVEEKAQGPVEEVEEEEAEVSKCPECGTELAVWPGVLKFRCPECGATLTVSEAEKEETNPDDSPIKVWWKRTFRGH